MSWQDIKECRVVEGCFGSDPEVVDYVLSSGHTDMGLHYNLLALINGASEAGYKSIPFEDATYKPVCFINLAMDTEGSPTPISDLNREGGDNEMKLRVAKCAYACGRATVGSCPLFAK